MYSLNSHHFAILLYREITLYGLFDCTTELWVGLTSVERGSVLEHLKIARSI
jgi:hypothetical protein